MWSTSSGGSLGCGSAAGGVMRTSSSVASVQRPGSISAMPRAGRSAGTPRRLSATRATPATWSTGSPESLQTADPDRLRRGGEQQFLAVADGPCGQRAGDDGAGPPDRERAVDPQPHRVDAAPRLAGASAGLASKLCQQAAQGGPQLIEALAGDGADADRLDAAEAGFPDFGEGLAGGGAGVGQVGPGDDEDAVAHAEGVHGGEVLGRLRHPAAVGRHHEHDGGDRAEAGQHVRHEPLVPGHVDEGELFSRPSALPPEPGRVIQA